MQFVSFQGGIAQALESAPEHLPADGLLWVDCHYDEARAWAPLIEKLTGASVFEDHLLDAENPDHPSYFDSTDSYEMVVFQGLALAPQLIDKGRSTRVRTRPTVFFVLPRCLVTIRAPDSRTVTALRTRLLERAPSRQRVPQSAEDLMLRILNGMVDRYLELRQPLTEQLERWQRHLLDGQRPFYDWYLLLEARGDLGRLEQLCEEQLDALQEWLDERLEIEPETVDLALGPLSDALQVRTNDVVNHVHRVLAHARRLQDSIESAVQLHYSATAHRTNEIMRTLTAISAVFMPLTLLTGIFGMNFEYIPGLHTRAGFWLSIVAMVLIAAGLLIWFRTRRYLPMPAPRRPARLTTEPPSPDAGGRSTKARR